MNLFYFIFYYILSYISKTTHTMALQTDANYVLKPAVNGLVTALAMSQVAGKEINVFGSYVPSYYVTGAVGALSSVVGEMAHRFILPHLSPNEKFAQVESSILSPAVAGAAQVGVLEMLAPGSAQSVGFTKVFAIGAGAEIVGQYAWEQTLMPLEDSF